MFKTAQNVKESPEYPKSNDMVCQNNPQTLLYNAKPCLHQKSINQKTKERTTHKRRNKKNYHKNELYYQYV